MNIAKFMANYRNKNVRDVKYVATINKKIYEIQALLEGISKDIENVIDLHEAYDLLEQFSSVSRWEKDNKVIENKKGKRPLILFISLENDTCENLLMWYKKVYYTLTGKHDIASVSEDEVIDKIYEYFAESNTTFIMNRYLPNVFGYEELVHLVDSFEDQGYYIVSCIIDYLSQMKKSYNNNISNITCEFLKSKSISLFTRQQLD